jgi:hypothetical protein
MGAQGARRVTTKRQRARKRQTRIARRIGRQRRTKSEVSVVSGTSRVQSQLICRTLVLGSDLARGSDIAEDWLVTAGPGNGVKPVLENYLCCGRRAGRIIRSRRADDHVVFVCNFWSWLLSRCNYTAFRLTHALLGSMLGIQDMGSKKEGINQPAINRKPVQAQAFGECQQRSVKAAHRKCTCLVTGRSAQM